MTPQYDTFPSHLTFCTRIIKRVIFQKCWRASSIFLRASLNPLIHKSFLLEAPVMSTGLTTIFSSIKHFVIRASLQWNFHPLYEILHLLQDLQFHFAIYLYHICIDLLATYRIWQSMKECPTKGLMHQWVVVLVANGAGSLGREYVNTWWVYWSSFLYHDNLCFSTQLCMGPDHDLPIHEISQILFITLEYRKPSGVCNNWSSCLELDGVSFCPQKQIFLG